MAMADLNPLTVPKGDVFAKKQPPGEERQWHDKADPIELDPV